MAFIFILFFMLSRTFAEAGEITPIVRLDTQRYFSILSGVCCTISP